MSTTLYRKYRPNTFAEIVDQNHIKITLQRAVATGNISHAYLFHGPRGIGKTTTARILAKALNCPNQKDGEPCNACDICKSINQGNFLDMVELDAASRRKIEEIKEFKEHIKYPPNQAKYKVFIIDEVHMLTDVSFNALLKTIEEPPEFAIFILCTTEIHKIPETIISRCQRYDFKKIPLTEIVINLQEIASQEGIRVDKEILHTVAQLSEGCLRDAQSLFGQIVALGEKNITWDQAEIMLPRSNLNLTVRLWQHINGNETAAGIELINTLSEEGVDLVYFLDQFIELLRRLLLYRVDKKLDELKGYLPKELYQEVTKQLSTTSVNELNHALSVFLAKKAQINLVNTPNILLEIALVELSQESKLDNASPKKPISPIKQIDAEFSHHKSDIGSKTTSTENSHVDYSELTSEEKNLFIKTILSI